MEKFEQLGLGKGMLGAIKNAGFSEPSEIQEKTIPLVVAGKDIIGVSATGSGKTLAFGAGIIDKVRRGAGIQVLVLTPTRELAEQVGQTLRKFSRFAELNVVEVYGGVSVEGQTRLMRSAEIVVGTPGRILDHLMRKTLKLNRIRHLVLDEADRMLDMGFLPDVESIIKSCPPQRQTLLFSATISQEVAHLGNKYMKNPVQVSVKNQVDPSKLYQVYYDVTPETKFSVLVQLLKMEKEGVVMVFCNTRRNVDRVARALQEQNIHAMAIHGGLSQNKRSSTLSSFHKRETLTLVCTDVAARGLDIKDVSHVYNFDMPVSETDYIHRIGRTARAGKNGIAVSFVSSGDHTEFRQISKTMSMEKHNTPKLDKIIPITFNSNATRKANRQKGKPVRKNSKGKRMEERKRFQDGPSKFGGRKFGKKKGGRAGPRFGKGNVKHKNRRR